MDAYQSLTLLVGPIAAIDLASQLLGSLGHAAFQPIVDVVERRLRRTDLGHHLVEHRAQSALDNVNDRQAS